MTYGERNRLLARRARAGDKVARDRLIVGNMPIVYSVTAKMRPACADALSVGAIGLIKAADSYDPERQYAFSTFAAKCVRNEILMEVRRARKHKRNVPMRAENQNGLSYEETLCTRDSSDTELEREAARKVLMDAIDTLPERERGILLMFSTGAGQARIAKSFGISQSYVSRLNQASIKSVSQLLADQMWIIGALRA